MKAYIKTTLRMFKKQLTRLFTIVAIVFVSVSLMFGVGELKNKVYQAINDVYIGQNVSDLIIKSQSTTGFSEEEISSIISEFGEENVLTGFSAELEINGKLTRIYSYDLTSNINSLELVEGEFPKSENEILVERETNQLSSYSVNDTIEVYGEVYTVVGIVTNPLLLSKVDETSYTEGETLECVIYFNGVLPSLIPEITNDIYVTLSDRTVFNSYSSYYEELIESVTENIDLENVVVLTLYENYGLYSMQSYADKVEKIALVFIVFFMLVTALVIFSTMTRLLDEDRSQIACQITLGYSNLRVINKYVLFIVVAVILGSAIAGPVGLGLTRLLYFAFEMQYSMPIFPDNFSIFYYVLSILIILISSVLVTLLSGHKLLSAKPSELLMAKTPRAGKKVLLERIPIIWNRLSFKYKSCLRNVFLFKSRFLMTVISIIGSTILVLSGLGLLDNALKMENSESIIIISVAILVFAGLLCALVIYNLANINISERNREISTLMVLGYTNIEVVGYIFREIFVMSFIGAIIGLPLGYFVLKFLFNFISFGSISDVNWWTWILGPVITIVFTVISCFLLCGKITKTDMNESLKTLD